METRDLVIVGAGPAGIATAVEARRAGLQRLVLLEKGSRHSCSIAKLYTAGKRVDRVWHGQDEPCEGATCIADGTRESLLATLDGFVQDYNLPIEHNVEVSSIERQAEHLVVHDAAGRSWRSRTVVIAIGVYGRPQRPDYPIPASLADRVHFDLADPVRKGESVLVVGGGNTALEYVAFLYATNPTTLAYRGARFSRVHEVNERILDDLVARGQVAVQLEADVESLHDAPDAPRVEVRFRDGRSARFDHVVYALGGSTPTAFLEQAGVAFDGRRPRFDASLRTAVPGLYLAGDLVADGHGSIVKALNSGHRVVWNGVCQRDLDCRLPA